MLTPSLIADVSGDGPPVVLLHGQPGSAADWAAVVPMLSSSHTVVVPDRPGYGRTGGEAGGFLANAAAVITLLDDLRFDRALVVGHSWGGGVALALAAYWPARVGGVVLAASVGPGERLSRVDRILAIRPVGATVAGLSLGVLSRAVATPTVRRLLGPQTAATTEDRLLASAEGWGMGKVRRSFVIEQRAFVQELPTLVSSLGSIIAPTTVIVGTADRVVPPRTGAHLAEAIPGARLVELSGAGHLLPHRHPTTIATAVTNLAGR